jgi:tetratricopeptide (TPR) repeat protein
LLLGTLVLASLGLSLGGGFVWDDAPLIVDNSRIQRPGEYVRILTASFWETGDQHDRFRAFFRPVVSLSYAADYALWGARPFGFHLTNLLLHFGCCWLVYRIGLREPIPRRAALAAAALFAVHPVHVESVAWISGRTDLLCAIFLLAAFLACRSSERGSGPVRGLLPPLLFGAALFAKEMAATLPLLVFADRWLAADEDGGRLRRAGSATWPLLVVLVLYLLARRLVLGPAPDPLFELGPLSWALSAVFVLARYVTLLLLPVGLDAHYPHAPLESAADPFFLVSAALLAVVGWGAWWLWRRDPRSAFWLGWILVSLLPVLALGRFGDVLLADRFLYIPSIGLALLAGRAVARWAGTEAPAPRRRALAATALLILGVLAVQSASRCRVWKDDLTLFRDMLRTSPASALVRNNLGLALYARGEYAQAIEEFRVAVALAGDYALARNNLASALERTGRPREALAEYLAALEIAPALMEAGVNAGNLLVRLGRPAEGFGLLEAALRDNPRSVAALNSMAGALEFAGRDDEALDYVERIASIDPSHAESRYLLGKIRYEQGRLEEAAAAMRQFLGRWAGGENEQTAAARRVVDEAAARNARPPAG